jgi:DNA-binding response OmpR family regulator
VTDFADAGLAPLLWNFVAMEAAIRFDWAETNSLQSLHEMEQCLVGSTFSKLDIHDIEPPLRKPVRAIMALRRLASRTFDRDPLPYHLGIMFHATNCLMDFNPAFRLTVNELVRLAHILLAAAMICSKIEQDMAVDAEPVMTGIRIDQANSAVWVDGIRVSLSKQSYGLLCYLYEHANQLRTRREIVERVFGQKYDEMDESQISRLNTAIRRLRESIEEEPSHPRYLLTEPTGGYRLVSQSKE